MPANKVTKDTLDNILALQIIVAWAGEGICDPKRLDWWRTDLIDENGGGDLFGRLFPKTHQWASLQAVRQAAIQQDRRKRLDMAKPDAVRTLFFWGFTVDEQLTERLAFHKQSGVKPIDVLPLFLDIYQPFSAADFEEAISIPHQKVDFKVVPSGREIFGEMLKALDECARKLAFALLPIVESYPMPFYRLEER
ncbi:BREX-6 system BrxE protein [Nostoc sp. FACHB-973]|nr:BREX-6 system BrxE protein [Nostoc sp. FACHB-973]